MLIRHLAIALPLALSACADVAEPTLGERQDNIICDPLCAPDRSYIPVLELTYSYGFQIFPDAGTSTESCVNLSSPTAPQWDCVVTYLTPTNSCGTVAVECRQGAHCSWSNPAGCQ